MARKRKHNPAAAWAALNASDRHGLANLSNTALGYSDLKWADIPATDRRKLARAMVSKAFTSQRTPTGAGGATLLPNEDELERMVDGGSVAQVVGALSTVCIQKEIHVEETWQDRALAKQWSKAARILSTAFKALNKIKVPGIQER